MKKTLVLIGLIIISPVLYCYNFYGSSNGCNEGLRYYNEENSADSCSDILLKDGSTISAIVLEVSTTQIKYKKCDRAYSPIYIIENSKVEKIIYPDGAEDIITTEDVIETEDDKPKAPDSNHDMDKAFKEARDVYLYDSQEVTYDKYVFIYFKNGKTIEGDLVQEKPGKYIKIKTSSGQINIYGFKDIDHIEYNTVE